MWKFIIFLLSIIMCKGNCARILAVVNVPGPSHYILGKAVVQTLAKAGHDVTLISPFEEKNKSKNGTWRDLVLTGVYEESQRRELNNLFDLEDINPVFALPFLNFMGRHYVEVTLGHKVVQDLLKSNEKFDVVITEQFNNDALKGLCWHFNASQIILSSIGANMWVNNLIGNPAPWSYIPSLSVGYTSQMTFFERVKNSLLNIIGDLNNELFVYPQQNALLQKYFPGAPHISNLVYNASLVLLNSHVSTNQPVPLVPNAVDIGGYHIKPSKSLSKDLKDYLDNAKEGAILFSMGSNLKSINFPIEKRKAILKAFSKLKQRILWKFEDDTLPGKPDNVKISKWLPQQDILAHPNVKLFITHGGLLSTTETVYFGKPILAIPIFGDQKSNAARAVSNGFGLILPFKEITEEKLSQKINELLYNKKYFNIAQKRSKIMNDRQTSPRDNLVYWVEYVIRHRGAEHLRVAALDLPLYQYLLLDVFLFLFASTFIVFYVLYKLIFLVCCRKQTTKPKLKSN